MALRMAAGGYGLNFIKNDYNLSMDVGRYFQGAEAFAKYVGEAYDSSSDYWKLIINDGKVFAEWDGTNDVTLPDGTVIPMGQGDNLWGSKARKALAGLFSNGAHADKDQEFKDKFVDGGLVWSESKNSWVYGSGENAGQIPSDTDGFRIDITSNFGEALANQANYSKGGLYQKAAFHNWINQGAEGFDHIELAKAPTELFWTLSKGKLENNMAGLVVTDTKGKINFESTKATFSAHLTDLNSSLASDWADALTYGLPKSIEENSDNFQYRDRYNSLIGAYANFLTDGVKLIDGKKKISQYYGPVTPNADGTFPNGYSFHPGIDYSLNTNQMMYPGFSGMVVNHYNNATEKKGLRPW